MPTIVLDDINLQTASLELQDKLISLRRAYKQNQIPEIIERETDDLERLVKQFNQRYPNRLINTYFHPDALNTINSAAAVQPLIDYIQTNLLSDMKVSASELDQSAAVIKAETDNRPQLQTSTSLTDILKRFRDQANTKALENQALAAQQYATEAASDQKAKTNQKIIEDVAQLETKLNDNILSLIQQAASVPQKEIVGNKYRDPVANIVHRVILTPHADKNRLSNHILEELEAENIEGLHITSENKSEIQLSLEAGLSTEAGLEHVTGKESRKYIQALFDVIQGDSPDLTNIQASIADYLVTEKKIDLETARKIGQTAQDTALAYAFTGTKLDTDSLQTYLKNANFAGLDSDALHKISLTAALFSDFAAANSLVQKAQTNALSNHLTPQILQKDSPPLFSLFESFTAPMENGNDTLDTLFSSFNYSAQTQPFWVNFKRIIAIEYFAHPPLTDFDESQAYVEFPPPAYTPPQSAHNYQGGRGLANTLIRGFFPKGSSPSGFAGKLMSQFGLPSSQTVGKVGIDQAIKKLAISKLAGEASVATIASFGGSIVLIIGGIILVCIAMMLLFVGPNTLLSTNIAPVRGNQQGTGGIGGGYCDPSDPTCPVAVCQGNCMCPTNCGPITQGPGGSYSHAPNSLNAVDIGLGGCAGNRNIFSISEGCVISTRYSSLIGQTVVVQNPDGTQLTYAHLDSYNIQAGAAGCKPGDPNYVTRGTQLGIGDNTGTASGGDHLHLEYTNPNGTAPPNILTLFFSSPNDVARLTTCSSDEGCGSCKNSN